MNTTLVKVQQQSQLLGKYDAKKKKKLEFLVVKREKEDHKTLSSVMCTGSTRYRG